MGRAGINSCFRQRPACWGLRHASLLVRCHAPQYRHLYVLSCAGADSLTVILYAAVAFASCSLEYMRFPDTAHVLGGSPLASSIPQEKFGLRCFAAIKKPHWALPHKATMLFLDVLAFVLPGNRPSLSHGQVPKPSRSVACRLSACVCLESVAFCALFIWLSSFLIWIRCLGLNGREG